MKEYEIYNNLKVPKGSKIILRLDGRNFHSLSKKLNFDKPYYEKFINSMISTSINIFKEFSPLFIYTFSDEISILLSEVPFSGRIEKLNSVFPSLASSSLANSLNKYFKNDVSNEKQIEKEIENDINHEKDFTNDIKYENELDNDISDEKEFDEDIKHEKNVINDSILISFDSRIIPISKNKDVVKYFKWRQDESWRNCINSYGYWKLRENYSAKEATQKLKSLKSSDIHQLLFGNGINLNNVPNYQKRGIAIYKKKEKIIGLNPIKNKEETSYRNKLIIDKKITTFNQGFFKKIDII